LAMITKSLKAAKTRVLSSLKSLPPQFADWTSILELDSERWKSARDAAKKGPKVLIADTAGIDSHVTTVDSLLAVALTLRGADVHVLVCDEMLAACWMAFSSRIAPSHFAKFGPSKQLCGKCFLTGSTVFRPLGLPTHRYSDFLASQDLETASELSAKVPIDEIQRFSLDGISVGEHALAGALRYYSRGDLAGEPEGEIVLRRYLHASLSSMFAIRRLLKTYPFTAVCGIHGMYVPEGLLGEVARSLKVDTISWADSYRKQTFIFSHYDSYHRTMLSEPTSTWQDMPWNEEMESEICEYLRSRWYGTHDWIRYTKDWSEDVTPAAAELGIDFGKTSIGLLTNVIWDAQLHYTGNAFPNMVQWTLETIRYFASRPDLQLIVRVHPAEVKAGHNKSRQFMVDEIKRAIPNLPKNVFVIPPDSSINTYAAMLKCNAVIIYGTKAGVELSSMGVPIIVAGEAWIRNKGLTLDASSPREYFEILDRLPLRERMGEEAVRQARKYAYHFFFRRHIPVSVLQEAKGAGFTKLAISRLADLLPGRCAGLDVVCDGIMKGAEFVYPAELYPPTLASTGKFTTTYSAALAAKQTTKPLVSVILPTRNHAHSLQKALDSVYGQDGAGKQFDIEVILVDNGSTDSTRQIANRYTGIHYIRLENPVALPAVRNIGLKAATGQYVAFLDDDNLWQSGRLLSHVSILEQHRDYGAVYGQFIATGFSENVIWPEAGSAPAGFVFKEFATEDFAVPSFVTVRRDVFEKAGHFDEGLHGMEYYDMFLRLAALVRFSFIAGPAGKSIYSNDNVWLGRLQRNEHETELPRILNRSLALLPKDSDTTQSAQDIAARWFIRIARFRDKPETVELLRRHVLRSIQESPWMMTDPVCRDLMLSYTSKVLMQTIPDDAGLIHPAIRRFCCEVRGTQNGDYKKNRFRTQHFLGDVLTRTAKHMWDRRDFRAAAFTASYAICQDITQVFPHIRGVSMRLARSILSAAT
jgi:glycosyltransferase involved in cell wall biosynthesis